MTRILNFGSCNIDYVYGLDHIVSPGETEASSELRIFSGGKGLNQSIAVARAGGAVFHAGQVGEDGAMLLDIMAESGVDVSNVKTVNMRSGHAIIQVTADGEKFAGSITPVRQMVKNLIDAGIDPVDAVRTGTLTPSSIIGEDKTVGSIEVGKRANG